MLKARRTLAEATAPAQGIAPRHQVPLCRKRRSRTALNKPTRRGNGCKSPTTRSPPAYSMIRFLFRFAGLFLLACAFVFLVYDGTKSIANQRVFYSRVSDVWAMIDQHSLDRVQVWLKQHALWAWDPYAVTIFGLPTWVLLAILALLLIVLGRRKKPLIGYARE